MIYLFLLVSAVVDWRCRRMPPWFLAGSMVVLLVVCAPMTLSPLGCVLGVGIPLIAGLPAGDAKWGGIVGLFTGYLPVMGGLAIACLALLAARDRMAGAPFVTIAAPCVAVILWHLPQ